MKNFTNLLIFLGIIGFVIVGCAKSDESSSAAASSSSAASAAFKIGGARWTNMKSGGRIGGVFIWEGTTLSTANITSVRNATKARWGL